LVGQLQSECQTTMMRINMSELSYRSQLEIEGELAGDGVDELFQAWVSSEGFTTREVTVDLSGVIHIDRRGRLLLRDMQARGVRFTGARLAVADVLNGLRPLTVVRSINREA
jgi:ABC-type transporter Mla MlaB component